MYKLTLVGLFSFLVLFPAQAEPDYAYFSKVLRLEQRWARLSAKTMDKYLIYLGQKGLYKDLSAEDEKKLKNEIRAALKSRLTWDKVGNKVSSTVIAGCKDETLKKFAQAYEGKDTKTSTQAAGKYLACASKGIDKSLVLIKDVFKEATPSIRNIAKKYRPEK